MNSTNAEVGVEFPGEISARRLQDLSCTVSTGARKCQLQRPQSSGVLMICRGDDHLTGVSFVYRFGEIGHDPV
jgi:hypothetical protein